MSAHERREELTRLVMAAEPTPFWLGRPDAPAAREPLRGDLACDLAVIGGGFSGLWAALLAKEANPGRSVVLIEGHRVGWAASGRNGGFCEASLTLSPRDDAGLGLKLAMPGQTAVVFHALQPERSRWRTPSQFPRCG